MKSHQVSFGIGIRFTDANGLSKAIEGWDPKFEVKKPWTINQIVKGKKGYTSGIRDCCAGGIITKSNDIVAFHIDPGEEINRNFDDVRGSILKKLDKEEPCNQFLIGAKNMEKDTLTSSFFGIIYPEAEGIIAQSLEMFAKMEEFLLQFKTPLTKIKGIPLLDDIGASFACNPTQNRLFIYLNSIGNVTSDMDLYKISASVDKFVKSDADEIVFY